jgi:UDP-glucose 4-epimerase
MSYSGNSTPSSESCFSEISTPATKVSVLLDEEYEAFTPTQIPQRVDEEFILVVGGLGYIGSHTAWELLKNGYNVVIMDNLSNCNTQALRNLENLTSNHFKTTRYPPVIDFYQTDYRDKEAMVAILRKYERIKPIHCGPPFSPRSKISGVIHFAGYKSVSESLVKPLDYYANNVCGMVGFLKTLSNFDIKTFIFSSSATVYGEVANNGGRLLETQCDATSCAGLTNPYGRTKWMCEAILNDLAVSDPEWTIMALRYFNPIGCDDSGMLGENPKDTPNNLMPIVVQAMSGERPFLEIFGTDWNTADGTAIRDFIHVSDLAAGHLAALKATKRENCQSGFHVYNLGTGTGHSVMEIVDTMRRISGKTIETRLSPRREGDVGVCVAEPSKSAMNLNWKTQKTLAQACWDICRYLGHSVGTISPLSEGTIF